MADKSKKRKKGTITEQDASSLLNRYTPQTVLSLLKEVSLAASKGKIDWSSLVENTGTGITCAREYHKLWRHIAYGENLADRLDPSSDPTDDDDSDLEYEVEAFPPVGREAALETSACVKVLSQELRVSANPHESHLQENRIIDCPLPINIPDKGGFPSAIGSQGTNIIIPVPLELQPMSTSNGGEKKPKTTKSDSKAPPRRKKKPWSEEEDMKLTAAVQKYGDCNWESVARNEFENERNQPELSQRWAILKKQKSNPILGMTSQQSEAERAAAHLAASIAISRAVGDNHKAKTAGGIRPMDNLNKAPTSLMDQHKSVSPGLLPNTARFPPANPSSGPDSRVKAAAVAAGARIASSADSSSLLDAARAQNVVHISTSSMNSQLPSNVHFIRNGLAKTPMAASPVVKPSVPRPGEEAQQARNVQSTKPSASKVQTTKVADMVLNSSAPAAADAAPSTSPVKDPKTGQVAAVSTTFSCGVGKEQEAQVCKNEPTDPTSGAANDPQ